MYVDFTESLFSGFKSLFFLIGTAPLTTLGVSLQLSVKAHRHIFGGTFERNAEGLIKIPTELTIKDKRNYELAIKVF